MEVIAAVLGLILLVYGLAEMLGRWMGLGSLAWGNRADPKIALTFDDGPSLKSEELLELLARHNLKATFFLTGQNAEKHPERLEKMRQAGHQLEAHGYWHRPAVLMAPWTEWSHIQKSAGQLYRPPWGIHSPFTRLFAAMNGKRVALWDLESQDWLEKPPAQLAERLLFYTKGGSVLLLHDGPERTLQILEVLLPKLLQAGYQPVRMDELDLKPLGPRQGILRALQGFDEKFDLEHKNFKPSNAPLQVFRLEAKTFPGPALEGIPIGVPCYEVHLESARLAALSPIQVIRVFRNSLKEVAQVVQANSEIKLIYGYSYLAHAAKAIGFSAAPLEHRDTLIATVASSWFLYLYRGELPKRARQTAEMSYMTREVLLEKYGGRAEGRELRAESQNP